MATDWNDPNHPQVQQIANSTPDQVSPEAAAQAVRDLHAQVSPQDLQPVLEQHYAAMDPEQMKAIVAQLQEQLAQSGNADSAAKAAAVDPQTATPQQAAELHAHAHEFHPNTVEKVVVVGAGAAALGGLAILAARHFSQQK
jgi:ribosomal protein L12E/L44/L45/RPP1/RPP2